VDQMVIAAQASAAAKLLGMLESSLNKGDAELVRVKGMRNALHEVEYRVSSRWPELTEANYCRNP
jgi:hypothetical protein